VNRTRSDRLTSEDEPLARDASSKEIGSEQLAQGTISLERRRSTAGGCIAPRRPTRNSVETTSFARKSSTARTEPHACPLPRSSMCGRRGEGGAPRESRIRNRAQTGVPSVRATSTRVTGH